VLTEGKGVANPDRNNPDTSPDDQGLCRKKKDWAEERTKANVGYEGARTEGKDQPTRKSLCLLLMNSK
jgi:hypothetical protein